jgi:hypothetical protein
MRNRKRDPSGYRQPVHGQHGVPPVGVSLLQGVDVFRGVFPEGSDVLGCAVPNPGIGNFGESCFNLSIGEKRKEV